MGISKVEFAGNTLIDLTGDTVQPTSLVAGYTATNSAGEKIEGEFIPIYFGDEDGVESVPLNADTLGGKTESQLSVANAEMLGGQSPDYYAKASEFIQLNSNLSNILCGNGVKGLQRGSDFNMDTHHSVSNGYGENEIAFDVFLGETKGTKPFSDGFLITMIWRPIGRTSPILHQVAFEDTNATTKHRAYYNGAWSSWV